MSAPKKPLRQLSKEVYVTENITESAIQTGCLQRIADALENMQTPFVASLNEIDRLRGRIKQLTDELEMANRSLISYKGHFKRLKNKQQH